MMATSTNGEARAKGESGARPAPRKRGGDAGMFADPSLWRAIVDVGRRGRRGRWQRWFETQHPGGLARAVEVLARCIGPEKRDLLAMRAGLERFIARLESDAEKQGPGRPVDQFELVRLWIAFEGAARAMRAQTGTALRKCRAEVRTPVVARAWRVAFDEEPPGVGTFRKRLQRARKGPFASFEASRKAKPNHA